MWRSNPHNPTGLLAAASAVAGVWDEAFWPLATGTWTRGDAATGAVVLGSLTKLLACPGLRVGYVLAPPDLVDRLARRQPRWSVNGLACAALPDLLATVDLATWSKETVRLREQLVAVLHRHGLAAAPSDANWVLVVAPDLRDELARQAILVRDCASFGLPGTVRIAVPTRTASTGWGRRWHDAGTDGLRDQQRRGQVDGGDRDLPGAGSAGHQGGTVQGPEHGPQLVRDPFGPRNRPGARGAGTGRPGRRPRWP